MSVCFLLGLRNLAKGVPFFLFFLDFFRLFVLVLSFLMRLIARAWSLFLSDVVSVRNILHATLFIFVLSLNIRFDFLVLATCLGYVVCSERYF